MKTLAKYLIILVLAGCACKPTIEYRVVPVPKPPTIEVPVLATATTGEQKAQALAEYIAALKSKLAEALLALEAYK